MPYVEGDGKLRIEQDADRRLEAGLRPVNDGSAELKSFVLPGREARRRPAFTSRARSAAAPSWRALAASERPRNPLALVYLNRLSDLLFILARAANGGAAEPLWKPGGSR